MKYFYCPKPDWDCPYYKDSIKIKGKEERCICTLEKPYEECDDFQAILGEDDCQLFKNYVKN